MVHAKILYGLEQAKVVSSVMYLMNCTKSNIAYFVSRLSKYTHNTNGDHWSALLCLLNYLKETMDWSLYSTNFLGVLVRYCDAIWGSYNDDVSFTKANMSS